MPLPQVGLTGAEDATGDTVFTPDAPSANSFARRRKPAWRWCFSAQRMSEIPVAVPDVRQAFALAEEPLKGVWQSSRDVRQSFFHMTKPLRNVWQRLRDKTNLLQDVRQPLLDVPQSFFHVTKSLKERGRGEKMMQRAKG